MMKLITIVSLAIFCLSLALATVVEHHPSPSPESTTDAIPSPEPSPDGESWESNPLLENVRETNPEVLRRLRAIRQDVVDNGCEINLCFALQGDDFITNTEFQDQIDFADLMVSILTTDETGNFCAVQYGSSTSAISPLTGQRLAFLDEVRGASRVGGFETNIAGALAYTGFQLRPRVEDANKIIILGDGLENVGFAPPRIAETIRDDNIDISAVAIGQFSITALTEITADSNKVFRVDDFFLLAEVVVGLVQDVCGYTL